MSSLQVRQDMGFQRREWKVQRIAWGIVTLILFGAILGLFGEAPLTTKTLNVPNGQIEYDRFVRYKTPTTLKVTLQRSAEGHSRVWISNEYLDKVHLETVTPRPDETKLTDGGVLYIFNSDPSTNEPHVIFHIRPVKPTGKISGEVRIDESEAVSIEQFSYP